MLLIYLLFKWYPWLYPKIFITRKEDGTLDIQNGNFRDMHYGHFARKPKHVGAVADPGGWGDTSPTGLKLRGLERSLYFVCENSNFFRRFAPIIVQLIRK
jgi:hypothetical protein